MWEQAIDKALSTTRANIGKFSDRFPIVTKDGKYVLESGTEWTSGFWPGILWLSYQYSGEKEFRDAAEQSTDRLRKRLLANQALDHHDIGFLYSLSSKAKWIVEKDEEAGRTNLQAADVLMKRWRPQSRIIQAWGPKDDPDNGGRIIIDCLMNLPLLFWAYQQTGSLTYYQTAVTQADQSRRFLVRGDDSSYHTFYFDQATGHALRGGTHQGYHDGSTWSRGQAWGIYGFALSYRCTNDPKYLETSKRMARYFIDQLPEDHVAYWDFSEPVTASTRRDSSASAIAASGILELISLLPEQDSDRSYFKDAVHRMMTSLTENYTPKEPYVEGFIEHGSYNIRKGNAPDDCMIWGDYFYLEALMRLEKGLTGYWYE